MPESVIIIYVQNKDPKDSVLLVEKKRLNQSVEIVNGFQGIEATELWEKLTKKKENNNEQV